MKIEIMYKELYVALNIFICRYNNNNKYSKTFINLFIPFPQIEL